MPQALNGNPINVNVYKTLNKESFIIDWSNSTTYKFFTFNKIRIIDEWAKNRSYNYPLPPAPLS
jgi:hypothetical protein